MVQISSSTVSYPASIDGAVLAFARLGDGSKLVGGDFTSVSGVPRNHIALLWHDGTLDPDFKPNVNGTVRALLELPDGGVLVGGDFTRVNGLVRNGLASLSSKRSIPAPVLLNPVSFQDRFEAEVATAVGWNYVVEYSDSVSGGVWMPLRSIAGDGATWRFGDTNTPVNLRYYRVKAE